MILQKAKVYTDFSVIQVADVPVPYQDKWLWRCVLSHATEPDLIVQEVTTERKSKFKDHLFQPVPFVLISKGNGPEKPDWVKLDEAMPAKTNLDERDNFFIARDAYRLAADLLISGVLKKNAVQEGSNAVQIADISTIAREIAQETVKLARSL